MEKFWMDYDEWAALRNFMGRPVPPLSMNGYETHLRYLYPGMPDDLVNSYVDTYMLMEGPGLPVVSSEHKQLYGKQLQY